MDSFDIEREFLGTRSSFDGPGDAENEGAWEKRRKVPHLEAADGVAKVRGVERQEETGDGDSTGFPRAAKRSSSLRPVQSLRMRPLPPFYDRVTV
ncbi:hypothetical protein L596_022804 [Steinernema carpocapsae]|uniref:Uncharacterized protein n=1 Tax=Steinernema carpocapsae TaxID=34508 RepID=A0A4U5MMT6_STECR|nr:hypothetical protein L596_022804 [Steinernema carpocapsae]